MYLKSLYLKNFRNYKEAEAHFSPGLNVFHGDNAQGKTNLLEAIYLIATGRSFRASHLSELIREGESYFFLQADLVRDSIPQQVKLSFDGTEKRLVLDGKEYNHFSPLLGLLPSVLYTPQDTDLITGSPALRRRFLNFHLAQSDPLYVHHLARYTRAMKQRNCLLKASTLTAIDCWEEEMAHSAAYLWQARAQMTVDLKAPLATHSQKLSHQKETHELQFSIPNRDYAEHLKKMRPRDLALGQTLSGPHRDDLSLLIDQKPARLFASEGQKKTAIAALKFAEWERLTAQVGAPALMSIDDLGVHLDETRTALLTQELAALSQVFFTTPGAYPAAHCLHIESGKIRTEA